MTFRAQTGETPLILDLSRTVSRGAGRIPTGVDRAELAYLDYLLGQSQPVFGLVRTRLGFLLLDRKGLVGLSRSVSDPSEISAADVLSRLTHRRDPARSRLETNARQLAFARSVRYGLGNLLQDNLPTGIEYLNIGHSNLNNRVFRTFWRVPGSSSTVALHDLFPLTHPQFNRPAATRKSESLASVISAHADRVIHISTSARTVNEEILARFGRCPPGVLAPLGLSTPLASEPPSEVPVSAYFLAIGTLEPRKNLGFLLDLWEMIADQQKFELPNLVLAGAQGWESAAFFERLTQHPLYGTKISWIESPDDGEAGALLRGARGLLFPSHAEGQGLPPLEAACVGVPVVCQPLPSLIELLGDYAMYKTCDDLAGWAKNIKGLLAGPTPQRLTVPDTLPTWERHFAVVFGDETSVMASGPADKGSALCV